MALKEPNPVQIMVIEAARHIRDGEIANVGMRLPLLAFALAKMTHAPHALGFFDAGIVRSLPVQKAFVTMCDAENVRGSVWCTDMMDLMNLMQRGKVDVGILGGAEVDGFGNLNTSYIGPADAPRVKLPGSGGACDIAMLSRRTVIMMAHDKRRLVSRVQYITSLGYGHDGRERERLHIGGGPEVLVTDRATFTFHNDEHRAALHSIHPGFTLSEVADRTGWEIIPQGAVPLQTKLPSDTEWSALGRLDPDGFWTGGG